MGNRLYSYVRHLDAESSFKGCGYVCLDRDTVCNKLGIARSTWYLWLSDRECFLKVEKVRRGPHKGKTLIRYRSLKQICYRNGLLPDHVTYMLPRELGSRMVALGLGAEAMVAKGQRQAEYCLKHSRQPEDSKQRGSAGRTKYDVITAQEAISSVSRAEKKVRVNPSSKETDKGLGVKTGFRFFPISGHQRVAGVSQLWLSKKLDRSETTARRRLSNAKRREYGLDPLQRRRVVYEITDQNLAARVEFYLYAEVRSSFGVMLLDGRPTVVGMIDIGSGRKAYILYTNVYQTQIDVFACKGLRYRLNRLVAFETRSQGFNTCHLMDDVYAV
ncbi:MAG: hypothetical protein ACRC62_36700 [Microcoleus sp.]